jgi:hypothetical protein
MKTNLALLLALAVASGAVYADEQKPEPKKPAAKKSAKAKPAAKNSDKNVFQKAESSIMDSAHRNKIWVQHSKNKKD